MSTISTETLPVLPLPDGVVLPEMVLSIVLQSSEATEIVDAAPNGRLLLVPRIDGEFASIGVIATIIKNDQPADGVRSVMIKAHGRAKVGGGVVGSSPGLWVTVDPVTPTEPSDETPALVAEYKATAAEMLKRIGGLPLAGALANEDDPETLADSISYWPELSLERRLELLETIDVDQRLRMATDWLKESLADRAITERIRSEVNEGLEQGQKEAILRRQMAAIKTELGESEDANEDYRSRLGALDLDEATTKAITREIDRLERAGDESTEANWIRAWLDTVFELPWNKLSSESVDLPRARSILDADHTGLIEVKDRLIEHLAVRKLRAARNAATDQSNSDTPDENTQRRRRRHRSTVLALVGPPGVGKTSLGQSVADALGRKFVRVALGGIRDEAEIRGHRRTYVGSRPGRLVQALIEADSMNPVVLLDEIDKVSGGWQGDPSAALLEVLDPAQNHSFRDNYLEFELDLSNVVFIATANVLDTIPGPLLDRLEVISIEGYTEAEKTTIATEHLLGRLLDDNGLTSDDVELTPDVIATIAGEYTREAGVRQLERKLDRVLRKTATTIALGDDSQLAPTNDKPVPITIDDLTDLLGQPIPREEVADRIDRPGIATGLAVTGAGGDVLFVETALIDGDGETLLTGQLGDVMKESATIVSSIVSAQADRLEIKVPENKRLHIHFPAGAVPKDGPSAGVTMTTAVVSLLSGRPVRSDVAMTGEVTLGGKVLPIGGVKQKILAAKRAGISTVIVPKANQADVDDIEDGVINGVEVHFVGEIDELLGLALTSTESDDTDRGA